MWFPLGNTPGWIPSSPTSPSQVKRQVPPTPKGLEETHPKDNASTSSTRCQQQPDPEAYLSFAGDKRKTTQQQNRRSCSLADTFKVFRNLSSLLKEQHLRAGGSRWSRTWESSENGKRCWETSPLQTPHLSMVFERLRALFG